MRDIPPFMLQPVLKPKPWGGRNLARLFGRALPTGENIGESWELSGRAGDSNLIADSPLAGKLLYDAIQAEPELILGKAVMERYGGSMPVLVKFIDACEALSVQVHPDDCAARALGENDPGKEEAWLVIEARPGATVVLGASSEISFERLVELCEEGRHADCLNFVEVEAGDVIEVPPGTLHSVGKGLVLLEVSQNSDLTYRVDDWGRKSASRELHRDKAGSIAICGPPAKLKDRPARNAPTLPLHTGRHFSVLEVVPGSDEVALDLDAFASVTGIRGAVRIRSGDSILEVEAGRTAFVPACVPETAISGSGRAVVIKPQTGS